MEGKWEGGKEVEKCEYQRVTKKLKSKGKGKDVREIYNNKRQGDRKVLENDRVRKRERVGEEKGSKQTQTRKIKEKEPSNCDKYESRGKGTASKSLTDIFTIGKAGRDKTTKYN